ncbi:MAG: hypothetical protein ACPGYT_15515 [Nitrospirales bacterium]
MRRLLVEKDKPASPFLQMGWQTPHQSNEMRELILGLRRRYRYTKMVERIYGDPAAGDRLLVKALYLAQTMDANRGIRIGDCRVVVN